MLIIAFTIMPSVSTTIFGSFSCDELDTEKSYLISDYSIDCDSSEYSIFGIYAVLMIFIYPIGIPYMFSRLLMAKKDKIKQSVEEREKDESLR